MAEVIVVEVKSFAVLQYVHIQLVLAFIHSVDKRDTSTVLKLLR